MSDGPDDIADSGGRERSVGATDPQLLLYDSLREEIHLRISINGRNLLSGLSVIGLIVAYALLSGEFIFLAVVPIIVSILLIQTFFQLTRILLASRQLTRIERAYTDEYPHFDWEHRYGMFGTDREIKNWRIDWTAVPQAIIFVLVVLGYFTSAYVGYVLWPPEGVDVLQVGVTRSVLVVIYAILTMLVGLAGYAYYRHQSVKPSSE